MFRESMGSSLSQQYPLPGTDFCFIYFSVAVTKNIMKKLKRESMFTDLKFSMTEQKHVGRDS